MVWGVSKTTLQGKFTINVCCLCMAIGIISDWLIRLSLCCFLAGNVDRHGSRVFLLLTHSSSGGLPLGVIITSNEQERTIVEGLQLLQTICPAGAFGGNGNDGPAVFITDDCTAERKALHAVFPQSVLLLCSFHLLQAVWRWLWDSKHGIQKHHRQGLFFHVKNMVYAEDATAVEAAFQSAISDPAVIRWAQAYSLNSRPFMKYDMHSMYMYLILSIWTISVIRYSCWNGAPNIIEFQIYLFPQFKK